MRNAVTMGAALVLGLGMAAWLVTSAGAQGGGTIEAEVKYNGAPQIEKLKVNKDTEKCGTEATIEKVVVGGNKGLANAVVSVPGVAAVTDNNGVAKLENVPAGKQKIEVWHETLGKQTKDVEVKAGQTAKVSFDMVKK